MFHLEGFVFLVVICVVNAAFTGSSFQQDGDAIKVPDEEGCNYGPCELMCRRLGFFKAICVGETCECSKFHQKDEPVEHNNIPNKDEDVTANEINECNPNACDQLCRRLKFPSGACVNGRCKCDNFRRGENVWRTFEPRVENKMVEELDSCTNSICNRVCRRLGFRSGKCIGGHCRCTKFLGANEQIEDSVSNAVDENSIEEKPRICKHERCNLLCRRSNFLGGTHHDGRCMCYRQLEEPTSENDVVDGNCLKRVCDKSCSRSGYLGGICSGDDCHCYKSLINSDITSSADQEIEDDIDNSLDVHENSLAECNQLTCHLGCGALGLNGGQCVTDKMCRCDITEDNEKEDQEEEEEESLEACNTVTCNTMCHRLMYIGGWCRFGNCECY